VWGTEKKEKKHFGLLSSIKRKKQRDQGKPLKETLHPKEKEKEVHAVGRG